MEQEVFTINGNLCTPRSLSVMYNVSTSSFDNMKEQKFTAVLPVARLILLLF